MKTILSTKTILALALGLTLLTTACGEGNVKRSIPVGDEVDFGASGETISGEGVGTTQATATTAVPSTTEVTTTTVVPSTTEAPTTTTEGVTETTEATTANTERAFREPRCGWEDDVAIVYEDNFICITSEGNFGIKEYIYDLDGDLRLITSFPLTFEDGCIVAEAFYLETLSGIELYKANFDSRKQKLIGEIEYREENGNCNVYAKKLLRFSNSPAEELSLILDVHAVTNTEAPDYVAYNCYEPTRFCHYYVLPVEAN